MVWALEADLDVTQASSNTFQLEWPRGSGNVREFPEVDRLEWVTVSLARKRLLKGQVPFLDRLQEAVGVAGGTKAPLRRQRVEAPFSLVEDNIGSTHDGTAGTVSRN